MKYFVLRPDEKFCDGPILGNQKNAFDLNWICREHFYKIPKRNIIPVFTAKDTIFPSIITSPYVLVSETVRSVFEMYGDMILAKDVVLVDSVKGCMKQYFMVVLEELTGEVETEKNVGGLKKTFILKSEGRPLVDRNIFMMELDRRRDIVINLDLAESILRRDAHGISLEEIELKER
ncbi:hypothetical protein [Lacrimispora sp.]|uniref:hypothetical protein n=1 Tax=Lacrimispora sp. TaxID=2719234 RepID=UPI0028AD2E9C|nr:hypothetical protein [Lacrimispora sp.]